MRKKIGVSEKEIFQVSISFQAMNYILTGGECV